VPTERELAEARELIEWLLISPWNRTGEIARSKACAYFGHEIHRPPTPSKPAQPCVCGKEGPK
jgi:hypothetical protein